MNEVFCVIIAIDSILINETGIRLRQALVNGKYSPEQIGMTSNMLSFTKDNWATASIGIGKFTDSNCGSCYGIVAPNIVGTLIAGQNLVIENKSLDGQITQFKVDSSGAFLNNSRFLVQSDNGGQVAIDPSFGLATGGGINKPLHTVDANGKLILNTENANLYTDLTGNLILKGKVYATGGDFKGDIYANNLYFNDGSGNVKTLLSQSKNKIDSQLLDLGNITLNGVTGDITMKGNINLSQGNINWGSNSPVKYQFSENGSGFWHETQNTTDVYRRDSTDGGVTWGEAYRIKDPGYIQKTSIDFTQVDSPKIVTNILNITTPQNNKGASGLLLGGYYAGEQREMLKISYFESTDPQINFSSPYGGYAYWNFNRTKFKSGSYLNFDGVHIEGLSIVATFG